MCGGFYACHRVCSVSCCRQPKIDHLGVGLVNFELTKTTHPPSLRGEPSRCQSERPNTIEPQRPMRYVYLTTIHAGCHSGSQSTSARSRKPCSQRWGATKPAHAAAGRNSRNAAGDPPTCIETALHQVMYLRRPRESVLREGHPLLKRKRLWFVR